MKLGKETTNVIKNAIIQDPTLSSLIKAFVEGNNPEMTQFSVDLEITINPIIGNGTKIEG
jgi:hypothetical protein